MLLTGKIDAVFETAKGASIVDFKTGSQVSAKDEGYIRQLMLYAALLKAAGERVGRTSLVQVSTAGVKDIEVPWSKEAQAAALEEFDTAVHELLSGQWRTATEASEYDALLELFK